MAVAKNPKNGKWYAKFRYKDYAGATIQKKKEGFATKKEAMKWEADFRAQYEGKERLTFKDAYEKYLADIENRVKNGTIVLKRRYYRHYQMLHDVEIASITPQLIRDWQNKYLLKADTNKRMRFTTRTARYINAQLSTFFEWCIKFCGLSVNPVTIAGNITIKSIAEKPETVKNIWQVSDFQRFISSIERFDYHLYYQLLFWCGLRRGEGLGLRVKDIDLKQKVIHIRQILTQENIIDTPKTKTSIRDVTIPDHLYTEINEYIRRLYSPQPDMLLFDRIKACVSGTFFYQQERIGMEPHIRLHDLRHSHASLLIHLGFTPDVVADRLGHANAQMVMRIYGHMYPQKRVEVTDALDKIAAEYADD